MLQFEDFKFLQCDFYVFLWTRRKKHSADPRLFTTYYKMFRTFAMKWQTD